VRPFIERERCGTVGVRFLQGCSEVVPPVKEVLSTESMGLVILNGKRFEDNDFVINFDDACLYGRDVQLLESSTGWLNDTCIHYYFRRLASKDNSRSIFLDPSVVSFLMHQCDDNDDLVDISRGYDNWTCSRLFVPINDNLSSENWTTPGAGTHWSLLVIVPAQSPLYLHMDSVPGSKNALTAQAVAEKWEEAYWLTLPYQNERAIRVQELDVPSQRNGNDCGMHVLAAVRALQGVEADASVAVYRAKLADTLEKDLSKNVMFMKEFRREIVDEIASFVS
jgi:hypothetical protein